MTSKTSLYRILLALAALLVLVVPLPLFSQSCALCYTQAASSGSHVIQALRSGILILIIPPTFMTVGLIFIVHRKSTQVRRIDTDTSEDENDRRQDW
jgi:hypothetical protein